MLLFKPDEEYKGRKVKINNTHKYNEKLSNKILVSRIYHLIKNIIYHDWVRFIAEM